jgi:hypothetical protein
MVTGRLDRSFGRGGRTVPRFISGAAPTYAGRRATAVALQPDGKILVVGGSPGIVVARYTRDVAQELP